MRQVFGEAGLRRVAVSKGAISQARGQAGAAPLRQRYEEQVRPVSRLESSNASFTRCA
ncbi:MAG: hypothetical protein LBE06_02080 [Azoarcus sp.]|nr:hypothetical protein [Azoarcus sp.]